MILYRLVAQTRLLSSLSACATLHSLCACIVIQSRASMNLFFKAISIAKPPRWVWPHFSAPIVVNFSCVPIATSLGLQNRAALLTRGQQGASSLCSLSLKMMILFLHLQQVRLRCVLALSARQAHARTPCQFNLTLVTSQQVALP